MRGGPEETKQLFSYVDMEDRIPADHPLRAVRRLVDEVLAKMSAQFAKLYSHTGRPSTAPERLLKASLVQAFFTQSCSVCGTQPIFAATDTIAAHRDA